MKDDHATRRWSRVLIAVLACCALVVGFAACGDSDDDGGGGGDTAASTAPADTGGTDTGAEAPPEPTGDASQTANDRPEKEATGTPIKTMTITSLDSQGPVYPNIANTAKLYQDWINKHGGIAGAPLEVIVCDEHGKPTDASACARQAVDENVVAVVGSFSFLGTNIMPILEKAGIPVFGECCPITPPQWESELSFPMGTQPMYGVGLIKRANEDGCQKVNAVIIDGAQGFLPPMENAMKAYGKKFNKTIILPPTSQDYTPQVAEATSDGADCVVMIVSETPYIAWNQAWVQSGTQAKMYGPQGNLDNVSIKGMGNALDGHIIAGMYPDLATTPWTVYRQQIEEAGLDTEEVDYNSLGGMGTWAAYTGFTMIAEEIPGAPETINAETFAEQASKTTALDTKGMVPVIDFTKEWDEFPAFKRLFNRTVVFSTIKDGKVVPLTEEFEDVSDLALGKKPAE